MRRVRAVGTRARCRPRDRAPRGAGACALVDLVKGIRRDRRDRRRKDVDEIYSSGCRTGCTRRARYPVPAGLEHSPPAELLPSGASASAARSGPEATLTRLWAAWAPSLLPSRASALPWYGRWRPSNHDGERTRSEAWERSAAILIVVSSVATQRWWVLLVLSPTRTGRSSSSTPARAPRPRRPARAFRPRSRRLRHRRDGVRASASAQRWSVDSSLSPSGSPVGARRLAPSSRPRRRIIL